MRTPILIVATLALSSLLVTGGCLTTLLTDPNTGETTELVSLDPNIVNAVEGAVETVSGVSSLFGTAGVSVSTLLLGALAVWKKVKPSLMEAKTEAAQYQAAASATVTAIEELKTIAPEACEKLKSLVDTKLSDQGIDPLIVENVIRALRGLEAKTETTATTETATTATADTTVTTETV